MVYTLQYIASTKFACVQQAVRVVIHTSTHNVQCVYYQESKQKNIVSSSIVTC